MSALMSPLLVSCASLCLVLVHAQKEITLKGLTELKAPYVERDETTGKLKGFYVDLLDELALIGKFNYTLNEIRNATKGKTANIQSASNGLVNEFYSQHADFAIAENLYKGNYRAWPRYVDFTEPYLVSGYSALVSKERLEEYGVYSIKEMLEKNRTKALQDQSSDGIALGTVGSSHTYTELSMNSDKTIARKVYSWLYNGNNAVVESREKGIQQALNKPFAFIQETINNELAVDKYCELTALPISQMYPNGTNDGIVYEYSIAVQKKSKYLDMFDKAIRELKANGKLNELKRRYWNRKCNGAASDKIHFIITSICTLFSLSISLFLLS